MTMIITIPPAEYCSSSNIVTLMMSNNNDLPDLTVSSHRACNRATSLACTSVIHSLPSLALPLSSGPGYIG